jgi:hypothetical protein
MAVAGDLESLEIGSTGAALGIRGPRSNGPWREFNLTPSQPRCSISIPTMTLLELQCALLRVDVTEDMLIKFRIIHECPLHRTLKTPGYQPAPR